MAQIALAAPSGSRKYTRRYATSPIRMAGVSSAGVSPQSITASNTPRPAGTWANQARELAQQEHREEHVERHPVRQQHVERGAREDPVRGPDGDLRERAPQGRTRQLPPPEPEVAAAGPAAPDQVHRRDTEADEAQGARGVERQPQEAGHQHGLQRERQPRRREQADDVGHRVEGDDPGRVAPGDAPLGVEPVADGRAGDDREGQGVRERVPQECRVGHAAEGKPPSQRRQGNRVVPGQREIAEHGGGKGEDQAERWKAPQLGDDLVQRMITQLRPQHEHGASEEQHAEGRADQLSPPPRHAPPGFGLSGRRPPPRAPRPGTPAPAPRYRASSSGAAPPWPDPTSRGPGRSSSSPAHSGRPARTGRTCP